MAKYWENIDYAYHDRWSARFCKFSLRRRLFCRASAASFWFHRIDNGPRVTILTPQIEQFVEQLLGGGDNTRVASVLGGGQNQVDQVLADVGIGKFHRTSDERTNAVIAWATLNGQAGVHALREQVLSLLFQTSRIGEAGESNLSQDRASRRC